MFTQNCFIKKNTKELRKKLIALGYKLNPCIKEGNDSYYDTLVCENNYYYDINEDRLLPYIRAKCINCGTNEELFLAIAALRDDSDFMQWFVSEADQSWVNIGIYMPKGSFFQCLTEYRYPEEFKDNEVFCNSVVPAHKATVEELIKHFKTNIREQYVSLETAKLAKQKGFNEPCTHFDGDFTGDYQRPSLLYTYADLSATSYLLPTQNQLLDWLRIQHYILLNITLYDFKQGDQYKMYYYAIVTQINSVPRKYTFTILKSTYEEALEEGLQIALNIIDND